MRRLVVLLSVFIALSVAGPAWCVSSPGDISLVQSGNAGFASATDPAVRVTGPSGVVSTSSQTGYAPQDVVISLPGGWTAQLDHSSPVHVALHIPAGVPPGSYTCSVIAGSDTEDFETSTLSVDASTAAPDAPTGFAGAANSAGTALVWTWYASRYATSYDIYRGASQGTEALLASGITALTYSDSAVAAGTTYWYFVRAVNSAGASTNTSEGYLTVPGTAGSGGTGSGGGTPPASTSTSPTSSGLSAALTWNKGALTITYAGQDSFVQCSWPGGSYTAGDGSTLTTPAPQVLSPAPPVGSSVVVFGKLTSRMVLTVHADPGAVPVDNVTTTVGGDGYVPQPKHNPGNLKIGFGNLGSISIPSGWWSEVIQFAAQAAAEAEGMTLPQITVAMQGQTTQVVGALNTNAATAHGDAGAALSDADTNAQSIQRDADTNQVTLANVVTNMEQKTQTDWNAGMNNLLTPSQSSIDALKSNWQALLDWGPYHFISSVEAVTHQAANDPTGGLSLPVMSVNVDNSIVIGGSGAVVQAHPAYQWYDTGQRVPLNWAPVTSTAIWPLFRGFEGGAVWMAFAVGLVWYLMPKQTL